MKIFKLKKKFGKCVLTLFNKEFTFTDYTDKLFKTHEGYSGERQISSTLSGIREDHINRYNFAIEMINKYNKGIKDGCDVFCGNGYGSNIISKNVQNLKSLLSIDGSKDAIKLANKYYKTDTITFKQKYFPFKLKENNYDFIVSLESIEHVKDDNAFIDNFKSALKDNGILILSTPNAEIHSLEVNIDPYHFRHYIFDNFVNFLKYKGFELLCWAGQDVYTYDENRKISGLVPIEDMNLKENIKGQFIIYVFRKKTEQK